MSVPEVRSCFTCEYLDNPVYTQECRTCWGHMNYKKKTEENTMGDDGGMPINETGNATSFFDAVTEMPVSKKDNINPDHYKSETSLECIEAMEIIFGRDAVIDFCRCNAWKYIWRWKNKNGTEDLGKAKWYLERAYNMLDGNDKRMDIIRGMIHYIGWKVEESDD